MPQSTIPFPARTPVQSTSLRWQSLSLVIVGIVVSTICHQMARPGLAMLAMCLSVATLATIVALAYVTHRHRERVCQQAIAHATERLQTRLERHCPRVPRPHVRRPFGVVRMDRQYLTVVRGRGR